MKTWIVDAAQGSPEWHAHRNNPNVFNASELACAMGIDPNGKKRSDLVRKYATGIDIEFSDYVYERVIKPGHRIEDFARKVVEKRIGEDFYPVVMAGEVEGIILSASLDGVTIGGDMTLECKSSNAELRQSLAQGIIPVGYKPQMENGLWLAGADVCLFTISDETEEGTISVEYRSDPDLRAKIVPTLKQFAEDVAFHQHVEVIPAAVAAPIKDLPAIVITASGSLTIETNFSRWGVELREFIEKIPGKPATDQEFADCKAAIAAFKTAEEMLDSEEKRVLSMVVSIEEMQREKKVLRDLSRNTRLALEKLVVERDLTVKLEIMQAGKDQLAEYVAKLNDRIGGRWMPVIAADFTQAIKSKRNYESMRGSVADLVAMKKVEASAVADTIEANRNVLDGDPPLYGYWLFLFPDFAQVGTKSTEDFKNLFTARMTAHLAQEEKKIEAERARIRAEEQAKAEREAQAEVERIRAEERAKAQVEQEARNAEIRNLQEIEQQKREKERAEYAAQIKASAEQKIAAANASDALQHGFGAADNSPPIKLGEISSRLGFNVTADFLAQLGFQPVGTERAAKLYAASSFPKICHALIEHIHSAMRAQLKA